MKAAKAPGLSTTKDLCAISAGRVEYGIAIGNSLREIIGIVIDDFIGAEVPHICMVRRTGGRNHMSTDVLGELDGKASHPPPP
jgi:hypothetical protein